MRVGGTFVEVLALLVVANGTPVLAARLLRGYCDCPVDGGVRLADERPLFGASKTWRGLIAALGATALAAMLLGYGAGFGLLLAALAMAGDLLSSFLKRRQGLAPSSRSTGLDQLPEALLPALYAVAWLGLPWWWAPLWALAFMLLEILASPLLFRLHIRKRPY